MKPAFYKYYNIISYLYIMFNDITLYEYPNSDRLIIIGDIHGDIKRFKNILTDAKIINNNLEWIAEPNNTIIVQVGDQIDSANRNTDINWEKIFDYEMIYFTNTLDLIAKSKGGRVISLIGNHELMNVIGDFTYVSNNSKTSMRQEMFKPGGSLSNILAKRPLVLKIGSLFFCHAGIKKNHLDVLSKYNKDISYINEIWRKFILKKAFDQEDVDIFNAIILSTDGILWSRNFDENETILNEVFNRLDCNYIFVGHTTVPHISLVNNKIFYIPADS